MPIKPMVGIIHLFELYNHVGSQSPYHYKLLFKTILEEGTFPEDWKK